LTKKVYLIQYLLIFSFLGKNQQKNWKKFWLKINSLKVAKVFSNKFFKKCLFFFILFYKLIKIPEFSFIISYKIVINVLFEREKRINIFV